MISESLLREIQFHVGRYMPLPAHMATELLLAFNEAQAEVAQARAEREALRELLNLHNLGGWTDAVEPMRRALQAEATIATLRAALTAAQELRESSETCVVCSAILEPREEEAPHCYDCVVTDEHEAERQDRITQLEIALAQAAPAQEGQR